MALATIVNFGPSHSQVEQALLQSQFFPNVKSGGDEIPPLFSSSNFSTEIAKALGSSQPQKASYVRIRTRRFDGLIRSLGLPHPVPYSKLVLHMSKRWPSLMARLGSQESMIRPTTPKKDGRIIVMDYGTPQHESVTKTIAAQGKRYRAKADISNCFPSLYTHALDWSLRGFETAKKNQRDNSWEGKLDQLVQNCHDGETKGVMIGPAASNILSEIVLQRIDERLRVEGFKFARFVDDYEGYFESRPEAELFLSRLDLALGSYRLTMNTRKTRIESLRLGFGEAWMNEVVAHLPTGSGAVATVRYLQQCEHLAIKYPAQSVLTYGIKTLLGSRSYPEVGKSSTKPRERKVDLPLSQELVRLAYMHPHLSPLMARHLVFAAPILSKVERMGVGEIVTKMLQEAAQRGETDTMLWLIYTLRKVLRIRIKINLIDLLIETHDDLVWTALAATSRLGLKHVVKRVSSMDSGDQTECQEHWLSRYELYRIGSLQDSDIHSTNEKQWFSAARTRRLKFSPLS